MISRRNFLRTCLLGSAAATFLPHIAKASRFSNQRILASSGATVNGPLYIGTPSSGKKRTILGLGASVLWGHGLDQTENYYSIMQTQIDTTVGVSVGNWVGRCLHIDDWQSGMFTGWDNGSGSTPSQATGYVYPTFSSPSPFDIPMNGFPNLAGFGTGDANQVTSPSNFKASPAVTPRLGHWLNPKIPPGLTIQGASKLNYQPFSGGVSHPSFVPAGIFGYYGSLEGSAVPNWTAGIGPTCPAGSSQNVPPTASCNADCQILFTGANQNIQGSAFWASSNNFIFVGLTGTGSVNVFATDSGGSSVLAQTLTVSDTQNIVTFSAGPFSGTPGLGNFSIFYNSGAKIAIQTLQPLSGIQAKNHLLMQICARNSYCLQDYVYPSGNLIYDANYIFGTSTANASVGATYTNNGQTFTVIRAAASSAVVYMANTTSSTPTGQPSTSGTLTKSGGTGDATITFSFWSGGTGQPLTTLIKQSIFNVPDGTTIDRPVYIIGDTYNSMFSRQSNWPATPGDRFTSGTYAYALLTLAKALGSSAYYGTGFSGDNNAGRIILTMPWCPPGSTGAMAFSPQQYQAAIQGLCTTPINVGMQNFDFIDQSGLDSLTDVNYGFPTTFTGSISGTTLTVSVAASGVGEGALSGTGISAGTLILSQLSGTPNGVGTYLINISQSVGSETMTLWASGPDGHFTHADGSHPTSPYYDTGSSGAYGGGSAKIANLFIQALGL